MLFLVSKNAYFYINFSFSVKEVYEAIDHLSFQQTQDLENILLLPILQDILQQVVIAFHGDNKVQL